MSKTPETWVAGGDETHGDGWTYYKPAKIQSPKIRGSRLTTAADPLPLSGMMQRVVKQR